MLLTVVLLAKVEMDDICVFSLLHSTVTFSLIKCVEDMIKHQYMSLKPVIWNDVNFSLWILRFQLYQSNNRQTNTGYWPNAGQCKDF